MSWSWRKILQIRPTIRHLFWHKIGNGKFVSAWFDTWCDLGPLSNLFAFRDIFAAGLNLKSKVSDIVVDGNWVSPIRDQLSHLAPPSLAEDNGDKICLRYDNVDHDFSVANVWDAIRPRDVEVPWFKVVWFTHCIPKHAFIYDSHDHLFFECQFAGKVWKDICLNVGLDFFSSRWNVILANVSQFAESRKAECIIAKLVLAATTYFV
uniref:uncharacterized protein LOC122604364 n=1 Tax=Erigeron canadensis TaxID=72917 RepID=UPI001CB8C4A3|nr:uncharacterized protein LOC122604364 [Erigeron canadensis]